MLCRTATIAMIAVAAQQIKKVATFNAGLSAGMASCPHITRGTHSLGASFHAVSGHERNPVQLASSTEGVPLRTHVHALICCHKQLA